MQVSDLSAEQQQQLAMQEGAKTPEDMIMVLKMLAEDPENLARALSMMGLDVSPEQVQQAAQWMDQSAGDSAGIPPDGEQGVDEASAAAGEAAVPPTEATSAAPDEEEEGAPTPEPVADEEAEAAPPQVPQAGPQQMPQRPPMPNMDDVVSASVMQGAPGPAPMMRGSPNMSKMKGPAGLRQPRGAGAGSNTPQAAMIMKLMQAAQARRGAR